MEALCYLVGVALGVSLGAVGMRLYCNQVISRNLETIAKLRSALVNLDDRLAKVSRSPSSSPTAGTGTPSGAPAGQQS